jgi:hypothetical protein
MKDRGFKLIPTPKIESLVEVACLRFKRNNQQVEIAVKDFFDFGVSINLTYAGVFLVITAPTFLGAYSQIKEMNIEG